MQYLKKHKAFILLFVAFLFFTLFLYVFTFLFHDLVPFQKENYTRNYHHYLEDPRINDHNYELLSSLSQADAQWYLKIAKVGYPKNPAVTDQHNKHLMDGLTYAFFPLFPLFIRSIDAFVHNIELAAFISTILLLIVNFFSLYYIISQLFSKNIAIKTIFILFLFPFSIFYRGFYAEGLLLFLLLWFSYFLIRKQFIYSSIFFALMSVTKGNVLLLLGLLFFSLVQETMGGKKHFSTIFLSIGIAISPFLLWCFYNYHQTGDFFYFYTVQSAWNSQGLLSIFHNIYTIIIFPFLPFHSFHYSKIEVLMVFITLILLLKSKKFLPSPLWWISFLLWITPLISKDLMSFSRLQMISFPLFIYIASLIHSEKTYVILSTLFFLGLLVVSLFFINWYWIG